jgi:tetratricopeptide (TPR) repeat protein
MSDENPNRKTRLALLAIPALLLAAGFLQKNIDASARPLQETKPELLLRSGNVLKKLSLGYDSLLADIYWTRAVQYFGERAQKPGANFDLLAPLLDITTTLDPKLMIAYRFGAIFLSEPKPDGAGEPEKAVELVKKGIAANPDEWRLYQDLGFLYSIRLNDNKKAAEAYLEGSKNPKSFIWMKVLAARVAESGDSPSTSKLIWEEVYASTQDEAIRKTALKHVKALDAAIGLKALGEAAEDYKKKFGRYPSTVDELRDTGLVSGTLRDPAGFPYRMGPNGVPELDPNTSIVLDPEANKKSDEK